MDDLTRPPGTDADAVLALFGGCNSETDGVELAYQALDLVVARYRLSGAQLVLRPGSMSPQVFVQGRAHVTPDVAVDLARCPSGLYASPDVVPITVQDGVTGCCEMALAAHAARLHAGQGAAGLPARPLMEDAVRRAASRSSRFRWRFTLVVLGTTGPGSPGARWRALASAVRAARRACDEAGAAGPGRAAAILADAGPEDVEAYVDRLRSAVADTFGPGLQVAAGSATAPADSVDPDQLWRLCRERLGAALPPGRGAGGKRQTAASEVELELRCLPDVVSVGTTGLTGPEARVQSVTVVTRRPSEALRREVVALATEQLGDVPVAVIDGGSSGVAPAPGPPAGPTPPTAPGTLPHPAPPSPGSHRGSPNGAPGTPGGRGAEAASRAGLPALDRLLAPTTEPR